MKKFYHQAKAVFIKKKQPIITTMLLTFVVAGYQNCQQQDEYFAKATLGALSEPPIETLTQPPVDEPKEASDGVGAVDTGVSLCDGGSSSDLICNPLGGGDSSPIVEPPAVPVSRLGLIASLYEGQGQGNLDQYFVEGYKHPENIYFSNFNVPTRAFDEGFGFGPNDYLKNRNGEKLIEWFAIEAKGHIVLPENEASGNYHIVTISDDGIKVSVGGKAIINNGAVHAPTIDCATELVALTKGEEKDFELKYFQGPRMHIALMTFIKKIDVEDSKKSSLCGSGNGPDELIKEGYKVISPSWFTLPAGY